jgi:hypothetical protein
MQSILTFGEILKTLAKMEALLANLSEYYTVVEQRSAIDDALIAQFQAKATELQAAAAALLTIDYDPDAGLPPEGP